MNKGNSRNLTIDAAKGIGIVAVVLGHSGNPDLSVWVNWFHMSLFFVLSGLFYRPRLTKSDLHQYSKRQASTLLLPYFFYGVLLILLTNITDIVGIASGLGRLLYGGSLLAGIFGPFWFITSFLLTKLCFAMLVYCFKERHSLVIGTIILLYLLGHYISLNPSLSEIDYFLSIETLTITLFFYSIGFYGKEVIQKNLSKPIFALVGTVLFALLVYMYKSGQFVYEFNIKDTIYHHILLDAFIPIILVLGVVSLCQFLPRKVQKALSIPGQHSITIMYLHIVIIVTLDRILAPMGLSGVGLIVIKTILGISIPLAFKLIVIKFVPKAQLLL